MTPAQIDHYLAAHCSELNRVYAVSREIKDPIACREINHFLIELAVIRIRYRLEQIKCK